MAEDKRSFVLYSDLIHTIKKMPNEKAGLLFLHILEYVNDLNPITEDLIIELSFEPIKQQLKRDLIKYQTKKTQWSEAGKRSAEQRSLNKSNEIQRTLTNVERNSTNVNSVATVSTVSVNDSVNVNVSVNDINNKNKKEKNLSSEVMIPNELELPFDSELFKESWIEWKQYKKIEHKFNYKSIISEGLALQKLQHLSKNNEQYAILIMKNTMSNGWQGFVEPKNQNNEQFKNSGQTTRNFADEKIQRVINSVLGANQK